MDNICIGKKTQLPLVECLGKVVAHTVFAPINVPSFANSAMDGFAVRAADLEQANPAHPVRLPIIETIGAGDNIAQIAAFGVVHIMTGAKIPNGFDAVVQIENVKLSSGNAEFSAPAPLGQNIREIGQDVVLGQEIVKSGVTINAEIIMLLAAVGIANLEVFPAVKLQIFSTGNEIIDFNEPVLPLGKIYNSTAPYLLARAKEIGVEATYGGIVADDAALFEKLIAQIPSGNIIITTGAVSMGKWDFIPQSLSKLGAKIHFHKVNIRPGKPIIFATLPNGNLFFGLPGNPISSAIGFKFFIEPALQAICGKPRPTPVNAKLENSFTKQGNFRQFVKAITKIQGSQIVTIITKGQESFKISPMAAANSWAILPESTTQFSAGEEIEIVPFGAEFGF